MSVFNMTVHPFAPRIVAAVMALAAVTPPDAAPGAVDAGPVVTLDVVHRRNGADRVAVSMSTWPGNRWVFSAPVYVVAGRHICDPVTTSAVRAPDGSVAVSATTAMPDSALIEIVLTPRPGAVDIEATLHNRGTVVWNPGALAVATLEAAASVGFAGGAAEAFFDEKLSTPQEFDVHQSTVDPFSYENGTLQPRDSQWFSRRRHPRHAANRALVARSSDDGARHVAVAFDRVYSMASTTRNPAGVRITADFGPVGVGRSATVHGRIYLFDGAKGALLSAFQGDFRARATNDTDGNTAGASEAAWDTTHTVAADVTAGVVRVTVSRVSSGAAERVTLYRRDVPEFRLGTDDRASLADLDTTGSVPVTSLTLDGKGASVTDKDVRTQHTYAYWIRSSAGATHPAPVRVRDPRIWWDERKVDTTIDETARAYPGRVTVTSFGHTGGGWDIRALHAGNTRRTVALIGGIHAGESGPEIILPVFERLLAEDRELLDAIGVWAMPLVNADEREKLCRGHAWYLRKNSAGVDINRNFDADWATVDDSYGKSTDDPEAGTYRGPSPASESETRAVMMLVTKTRPGVVLSYHGVTSATGPLCVIAIGGTEENHDRVMNVVRAYQAGYDGDSTVAEDRAPRFMPRGVSGSLALWMSLQFDGPAADLELENSPVLDAAVMDLVTPRMLDEVREHHYHAVRCLLEYLRDHPEMMPRR